MSEIPHSAAATVASWRAASERGDVDAAAACLSPHVVLSSPLTEQYRFEGPDPLRDFLTSAFTAVQDIRFHTHTGEGDAYALFYRLNLDPRPAPGEDTVGAGLAGQVRGDAVGVGRALVAAQIDGACGRADRVSGLLDQFGGERAGGGGVLAGVDVAGDLDVWRRRV